MLDDAIPAQYRAKATPEGTTWFGFSTRARVIVYDKVKVKSEDVDTYEELADAKNKGKICIRSGSHPYNLSLFGAVTKHMGEQKAEAWLKGVVANLARERKGGDTDRSREWVPANARSSVSNSYYVERLLRSSNPDDKAPDGARSTWCSRTRTSWGTHVNIAGGAVAKNAQNPANAVKFLEYLAGTEAQTTLPTATTGAHGRGGEGEQQGTAGHRRRRRPLSKARRSRWQPWAPTTSRLRQIMTGWASSSCHRPSHRGKELGFPGRGESFFFRLN